jgi:deoxyribodipyrimidine photo-lyase
MVINVFIFRRDLRTRDNLALNSLLHKGGNILPIFIFNPQQIYAKHNAYFSNNAVQFMVESLESLDKQIHINYFEDDDINVLEQLKKKYTIDTIAFNKDYTPYAIKRDEKIIEWCKQNDINVLTEEDYTLFKMGSIVNATGKPYQVFTPFYKASLKQKVNKPITSSLAKVHFINLNNKFDKHKYYVPNDQLAVNGGRENALKRLKLNYESYAKSRDYPSLDSTTKLSAYIKFGCVSIREVYHSLKKNQPLSRELIWREFYANILFQFPHVLGESFKQKYDNIKWSNNKEWFQKWCEGKTGFPLVDAGMQQLNQTGWMHNRVRMVVAMFLTKDLLIDWRWGEKYFATKLVDYDPASNNGGWQWSSSTGTDAQPYFRIFSPELQTKKYDKNLEYITKWNPNYKDIEPIVDHKERAKLAIAIFKQV